MSKSIAISPNHGLNPSIPSCFFCGKPKNELVLFGKLKGDAEAPKHFIMDYEPCDACRKAFKAGVLFLGVTKDQPADKRPPIADGLYPTGSFFVLKRDAIPKIFSEEDTAAFLKSGKVFVEQPALEELMEQLGIETTKEE